MQTFRLSVQRDHSPLMCVYFCGVACIENLSKHLMPCVYQHPKLRTYCSDTMLRKIEALTEDNIAYISDNGKTYELNKVEKLSCQGMTIYNRSSLSKYFCSDYLTLIFSRFVTVIGFPIGGTSCSKLGDTLIVFVSNTLTGLPLCLPGCQSFVERKAFNTDFSKSDNPPDFLPNILAPTKCPFSSITNWTCTLVCR